MLDSSRTGKLRVEIHTRGLRIPGPIKCGAFSPLSGHRRKRPIWDVVTEEKGKGISGTMKLAFPWGPRALAKPMGIPTLETIRALQSDWSSRATPCGEAAWSPQEGLPAALWHCGVVFP